MRQIPVKLDWLERAVQIHNYYVQNRKDIPNLKRLSEDLNMSIGSVSSYLSVASWYKTHEKQLRRCSSMRDALAWIKMKEREMNDKEIDA